jgi:pimeloyl-ACP methyl ester carboxylesterase
MEINFVTQGSGDPIILIHGIAASLHDWDDSLPVLAQAGYQAIAMDLPGHGESIKPTDPEHYSVEAIYGRVERWLEHLQLDQPPVIVGHSLGGDIALMYALRHPDVVKGLVLVSPYYTPQQLSPILRAVRRHGRLGERFMPRLPAWIIETVTRLSPAPNDRFSKQALKQIALDYKRSAPQIAYIPHSMDDLTPHLSRISRPALVMWGNRDLTLHPGSFPRLVESLPNARGHLFEKSGHQPHIGRTGEFTELALEFLEELKE